jgi:hypothetical protein
MKAAMNTIRSHRRHSGHIRHIYHRTPDRPLARLMYDVPSMVLCILPCCNR